MEPTKNFVSEKFPTARISLPLFMLSRNRIKYSKLNQIRKYADTKRCTDEGLGKVASRRVGKAGLPPVTKQPNQNEIKKWSPKPVKKTWQLPPNRYDITKIPYESKSGTGGAHWPKSHTHKAKPRPSIPEANYEIYSLRETNERLFASCNREKGIFMRNARERRATSRCMITNIATCYKNPSYPGPATYNPSYKKTMFPKSLAPPNPHIFYTSSNVPVKKNIIHTSNTSFSGAPGRYETRYIKSCPCSSRLIYSPQIELWIEREKRKKFRRLSYKRIKPRHYTSPEWQHVKGRGLSYLFIRPKLSKSNEQEARNQKNIKLYPDSKYIAMINHPLRTPLSFRPSPLPSIMPRFKFNCFVKTITRRTLKRNKKTAFNSTQDRFRDSFRLPLLTHKRQEELKQALPLERQFRDHPIMNKRHSEIKSKLNEIPKYLLPNYVPTLRKKMFKFQPLPQAKILVTEDDTNPKEVIKEAYYLRALEATNFLKETAQT